MGLLYKKEIAINDSISIVIPKVGQILDDEDSYYGGVSLFTAMPIDHMVMLDDIGIDFSTINEYELFLFLFAGYMAGDKEDRPKLDLVLKDIDLTEFKMVINKQNDTRVLWNEKRDIVIDRAIHGQIADALRGLHHLEKNNRKPGNEEARKYMIERARKKQKRLKNKAKTSHLEPLIVAMVNTEQYKYDFEGTRELSIYQFNESVRQIINKVDYDNRMLGVYTGNINAKELSQDDLNWLIHK